MTLSKRRATKKNIEKFMHKGNIGAFKKTNKSAVCSMDEFDDLNLVNDHKSKTNPGEFDTTMQDMKENIHDDSKNSKKDQPKNKDITTLDDDAPLSDSSTSSDCSKSTDSPPNSTASRIRDLGEMSSLESEDLLPLSELRRRQRRYAAAMRNQHSNGPMILSRRMSYKLSSAHHSPAFSPITAIQLVFSPGTIGHAKKNGPSLDPR